MKSLITTLSFVILTIILAAQPIDATIKFQNRTRSFIVYLPQDYILGESLPLVINMHAFVGTASGQMNYTKYNRLADTARCIVVYPNGLGGRWNSGTFFGLSTPIDDVGFIGRLIDYMTLLYHIDTRRVYATGYSAGGFMSYKLACDLTNRIAAIAPVAASMVPDGNFNNCNPDRPIPVLAINSVNDPVTIYNGFQSVTPIDDVIRLWQQLNGCDEFPIEEIVPNIVLNDGSTVVKFTFQNCDNSELILMKEFNAGHTWPGANTVPFLGNTNMDISATKESWAFFKRHSIPEELVCEKPFNLSYSIVSGNLTFSWNPLTDVDYYSVFIEFPNGEIEYLENIENHSIEIPVSQEGNFKWAVRAQCTSGHVTWSDIQDGELGFRIANETIWNIYPNPATTSLFIDYNNDAFPQTYFLYDIFGNILKNGWLDSKSEMIDISLLSEGWYSVQLSSTSERKIFLKY